ncbi:hypothetical protein D4R51_02480, partial [bacterium]
PGAGAPVAPPETGAGFSGVGLPGEELTSAAGELNMWAKLLRLARTGLVIFGVWTWLALLLFRPAKKSAKPKTKTPKNTINSNILRYFFI